VSHLSNPVALPVHLKLLLLEHPVRFELEALEVILSHELTLTDFGFPLSSKALAYRRIQASRKRLKVERDHVCLLRKSTCDRPGQLQTSAGEELLVRTPQPSLSASGTTDHTPEAAQLPKQLLGARGKVTLRNLRSTWHVDEIQTRITYRLRAAQDALCLCDSRTPELLSTSGETNNLVQGAEGAPGKASGGCRRARGLQDVPFYVLRETALREPLKSSQGQLVQLPLNLPLASCLL
jgi:hypothetical protein